MATIEAEEDWNLSRGEWEALKRLRRDNTVVIKSADKGCVVVVMDREQYESEAMWQLQDGKFYKSLDKPIILESIDITAEELEQQGYLTERHMQYVRGQDKDKDRVSWPFPYVPPGRPIMSDCGSEL